MGCNKKMCISIEHRLKVIISCRENFDQKVRQADLIKRYRGQKDFGWGANLSLWMSHFASKMGSISEIFWWPSKVKDYQADQEEIAKQI